MAPGDTKREEQKRNKKKRKNKREMDKKEKTKNKRKNWKYKNRPMWQHRKSEARWVPEKPTKWTNPYIGRWEDWTQRLLGNGRANVWYEDTRKSLYVAYVDTGKPHIGRADTGDKWTHKRMRKKKKGKCERE